MLTILLDKCQTKSFEDMNILIKAILKFCTTNQLLEKAKLLVGITKCIHVVISLTPIWFFIVANIEQNFIYNTEQSTSICVVFVTNISTNIINYYVILNGDGEPTSFNYH